DRDRIFEPYQRSHSHDGFTASIGVGLTVARRLARVMGGDLEYRYARDQSEFVLSLRRSRQEAKAQPA
nr:ATP-binding protein [Acidimicrobiia bacterium]